MKQLRGALLMFLLAINTLFWFSLMVPIALVKFLFTKTALRAPVGYFLDRVANGWLICIVAFMDTLLPIDWDIRGTDGLNIEGRYVITSNHQSWSDIPVLFKVFKNKTPFFKFFLKQELIWVPVLGLTWWGLDYPFMKRYSKAQIAKNPALRGSDIETTRKACEKFSKAPFAVFNFLEGTRFNAHKHQQQGAAFKHLLKPKTAGLAFAIGALGSQVESFIDTTIVYPKGAQELWPFLCCEPRKIIIEVQKRPIPPHFFTGDYENDAAFRAEIQAWVSQIWAEKDQRIQQLLAENA
jgi:1-acyl-sn-glycerol-3-phosphate acyltransferase